MATIKANKDKARFVSNTISQDTLDGDWVDHEVITKYKLPEIIIDGTSNSTSLISTVTPTTVDEITVDASTTTTSLESFDVITTGDSLLVYNATDGMVDRTAGTVTTTGSGIVSSTNPFGDGSLLSKIRFEGSDNTQDIGAFTITNIGTVNYGVSGKFGLGAELSGTGNIQTSYTRQSIFSLSFWVKFNSVATATRLVSDVSGYWYLEFTSVGVLPLASFGQTSVTKTGVTTGVWHHIALTSNGSQLGYYFNNGLVGTSGLPAGGLNEAIMLGAASSGVNKINATIDQIEYYNKALTAGEVTALYTQTATKYQAPITATTVPTTKAYHELVYADIQNVDVRLYNATDGIVNDSISATGITIAGNNDVTMTIPITGLSTPPTKAYFNKTIDTTLSAEATGKCKSSTVTQIGVL